MGPEGIRPGKFGPGQLKIRIPAAEGELFGIFHVKNLGILQLTLEGGIAPYRRGITDYVVIDQIHVEKGYDAAGIMGITEKGIDVTKLAHSITIGDALKHITLTLYDKDLVPGSDKYKLAVFNAILGRFCDPDKVLECSITDVLKRPKMKLTTKALAAANYINFINPDRSDIEPRAQYVAELAADLATEGTMPIKNTRWMFIGVIASLLYREAGDGDARLIFVTRALMNLHDDLIDSQQGLAWIKGQIVRAKTT